VALLKDTSFEARMRHIRSSGDSIRALRWRLSGPMRAEACVRKATRSILVRKAALPWYAGICRGTETSPRQPHQPDFCEAVLIWRGQKAARAGSLAWSCRSLHLIFGDSIFSALHTTLPPPCSRFSTASP